MKRKAIVTITRVQKTTIELDEEEARDLDIPTIIGDHSDELSARFWEDSETKHETIELLPLVYQPTVDPLTDAVVFSRDDSDDAIELLVTVVESEGGLPALSVTTTGDAGIRLFVNGNPIVQSPKVQEKRMPVTAHGVRSVLRRYATRGTWNAAVDGFLYHRVLENLGLTDRDVMRVVPDALTPTARIILRTIREEEPKVGHIEAVHRALEHS